VREADDRTADIEPNDTIEGALVVEPGTTVAGSLGFADDVDVVCSTRRGVVWTIEDGARRPGTVLEATPYVGDAPRPLARVHEPKASPNLGLPTMPADVRGPWRTSPCSDARCCLKLGLVRDPWAPPDAAGPLPDATRYQVTLETVE
jgi:hypothetical protein